MSKKATRRPTKKPTIKTRKKVGAKTAPPGIETNVPPPIDAAFAEAYNAMGTLPVSREIHKHIAEVFKRLALKLQAFYQKGTVSPDVSPNSSKR